MYKTNRKPSTAVPATLGSSPFIPSSAPGSDQPWKKSASRKAKTRMSNKINPQKENIKPRPNTEYDDKFVEYDLNAHEKLIPYDRKHALTGFYETDMMVSDWKSEQKHSYNKKDNHSNSNNNIAGISNPAHENIAESFTWANENAKEQKNIVPGKLFSENASQFKWPSTVQHVEPKYGGKSTTIQLDMDNNGTQDWHSEYNQRCAELRKKQAELIANQNTFKSAGVASVPHDQIPTFYAWEEDDSIPRQIPVPTPSANAPHRSMSEYKKSYVDWPTVGKQAPIINANQLDLFDDKNVLASSYNDRVISVLKEKYQGYDMNALNEVHALPAAGMSSKNLQRSIQNHLVTDGIDPSNPIYSTGLDDSSPSVLKFNNEDIIVSDKKNKKVKNLTLNNNSSEYTAKFAAPPAAAIRENISKTSKASTQNSSLNLFEDVTGVVNESKNDLSEYNAQYTKYSENTPVVSSTKSKSIASSKHPVQFAWELEHKDPSSIAVEPIPRQKRPIDICKDVVTEYQRTFQLPSAASIASSATMPPTVAGVPTKRKNEKDPIMALDEIDLNTSKWQSEYDERCALLRKKQQDLINSNQQQQKQQHIAGIPSKLKDEIPTNYAWEKLSENRNNPSDIVQKSSSNTDTDGSRTTEYDEKFVKWSEVSTNSMPIAGTSHTKGHQNLNIFSEESKINQTNDNSEDLSYEIISKPNISEYNENFHALTVNPFLQSIAKKPISSIPSQFAWERIDPPRTVLEDKVTTQAKATSGIENSEYNSKFSWPSIPSTDYLSINHKALIINHDDDIIVPIPGKSDSDLNIPSKWISEYDDHSADIQKSSSNTNIPAGIVSIKQDDLPHFYAWLDTEATKPVKQPVLPKYTCEQVKSEHDERYVAWPASKFEKIIPSSSSESYNIITNETEDSALYTVASEYDDKFVSHSIEDVKNQFNPYNSSIKPIETSLHGEIPPQFAWPLVDGIATKKVDIPSKNNALKDTEYNSQYIWRDLSSNSNNEDVLKSTRPAENPITLDIANIKADSWISEYNERSQTVQEKLHTKELDKKPIAGIITPENAVDAPPFYAWAASKDLTIDATAPSSVNTTTKPINPDLITEYSANFKTWPVKQEKLNKSRQTELQYGETFKNFSFLCKDRSFSGVSEYDAQYQSKENSSNHSNFVTNRDRYNVDTSPFYPIDVTTIKEIKTTSKNPSTTAAFITETSDNFKWPQPITDLKNPLQWNKSQVVFGTNHPQVVTSKSKSKASEIPFKSARLYDTMFNRLKSTSNDNIGESETKANYSWPNHSSSMKSTQLLSSTSEATINRNRIMNDQFIPPQKYTTTATADTTGVLSMDSLAESTSSTKLIQPTNIPGLREAFDSYRPRSAPPTMSTRRRPHATTTSMTYENMKSFKSKGLSFEEDNSSNPVLMNKRYPYVSKKQLGRWTTETSDSFKWKKKNIPTRVVTSTYTM